MRPSALVIAAFVGIASPAHGQAEPGAVPAARGALAACLRDSGTTARACIGAVAIPCIREAGGDRREAEITCSRREREAWRERLQAASRVLLTRLDAGGRERFAALQRTWEGFSAQNCSFVGEASPPARASSIQAGCELQEVAQRAIEIERLVRGQPDPRSGPPRLER